MTMLNSARSDYAGWCFRGVFITFMTKQYPCMLLKSAYYKRRQCNSWKEILFCEQIFHVIQHLSYAHMETTMKTLIFSLFPLGKWVLSSGGLLRHFIQLHRCLRRKFLFLIQCMEFARVHPGQISPSWLVSCYIFTQKQVAK